jgi:hypothetical protein
VLAYQYIQALPSIASGTANKVWVVPAELTKAMENLGSAFVRPAGTGEAAAVDAAPAAVEAPSDPGTSTT